MLHLLKGERLIMTNNVNYINIREVLSRVTRHPLLTDVGLETAIQYTLDFIAAMGLPNVYLENIADIEVQDYRAMLPCDLVSVIQVRMKESGQCLRYMTDTFGSYKEEKKEEYTYKTQGRIIYTSFKNGHIQIAYKAIPVDEEGLPLIPDNPIFLKALELYIKKEWFTVLFDMGKIQPAVLNNTQQEYAFKAGQCNSEFIIPSLSEMESITGMLNQLISRTNEFKRGFKDLGSREYIKRH